MGKLKIVNRYWVVPNSLLNNKEISLKAKWLFGLMQSKPEDWDFSARGIASETKDWIDWVNSGLQELEKFWYLKRQKFKDDKGFWEMEYILYDTPFMEKPILENPVVENPVLENPQTIKEINNKEIINKYINNIFSVWNWKWIIKHKKLTSIIEKKIITALKSYSEDEIIKWIDNYAEIVLSEDTWFDYKWTLAEFLQRENWLNVFYYKTKDDYLKGWIWEKKQDNIQENWDFNW